MKVSKTQQQTVTHERERKTVTRINTTQLQIALHPYATQTFKTFDEMVKWLNSPLTATLWKVGRIDWMHLTVRVEGKARMNTK